MNLFFDSIILLYLIASTIFGISLWRDRKRPHTWESRYPKFTLTSAVLLCFSAVLIFWGSFIEPRLITINRVAIDLPNFEPTEPVRVALISDIHVGTYKKFGWLRRVSNRIIQEQPDLVLLAGDFIVNKPEHSQYLSTFSILHSAFPVYAVLGDHDYHVEKPELTIDESVAKVVRNTLTNAGIRVLSNESVPLTINNGTFTLIGLDDWLAGKTDMKRALTSVPPYPRTRVPKIVLTHNPDFILDPESKNADLILAGNTHGGQIRLPFIGPVARLPSALSRSFDEGLFTLTNGTRLFITSGISESGPRARLFNPPEIVMLSLD